MIGILTENDTNQWMSNVDIDDKYLHNFKPSDPTIEIKS
jgi:hypothetical protein